MKKEFFKETNEDWCPSYEIDNRKLLRVRLCQLTNKQWRVCVWGADDFGMECDTKDYDTALGKFLIIVLSEKPLTRKFLKNMGFINA